MISNHRMWRFVCIQLFVLCMSCCYAFPKYAMNTRPVMRVPSNIKDIDNSNLKKAFRDVSDTITEVQKFLERDPTLPRLTRGEIEELFEKVTREEYERSLNEGNMNRAVHMKSLMLVLPYNANSNSMIEVRQRARSCIATTRAGSFDVAFHVDINFSFWFFCFISINLVCTGILYSSADNENHR